MGAELLVFYRASFMKHSTIEESLKALDKARDVVEDKRDRLRSKHMMSSFSEKQISVFEKLFHEFDHIRLDQEQANEEKLRREQANYEKEEHFKKMVQEKIQEYAKKNNSNHELETQLDLSKMCLASIDGKTESTEDAKDKIRVIIEAINTI